MPTVDFTLEDIRTSLLPEIQAIVDESIDTRFKQFEQSYESDVAAIQQDFLAIYGRFDRLETDLKDVKKDTRYIMKLRARTA